MDIAQTVEPSPISVPTTEGLEHVVDKILNQHCNGKVYKCFTMMKGYPHDHATLVPNKSFFDKDKTVITA